MIGPRILAVFNGSYPANAPTLTTLLTLLVGAVSVYATIRAFYLVYFHPLSRFPGPRIAAISNIWYAYYCRVSTNAQSGLSGRWPWAVEDVLREYGNVVRIAPNELVFVTPQAFLDIYSPQHKNLETFVKTDFQNRGKDLGGIVWEEDPVRHRNVARQLAPAFSNRTIRLMEPVVDKHLNYFLDRMEQLGSAVDGIRLGEWTNWLAMDLAADIAWSEEFHQMRDMKNAVYLDVLLGFNAFATVIQVFKRFPLLKPMQYLFLPLTKLSSLSLMESATKKAVLRRIDRRGQLEHVDYFDFILPNDKPIPTNKGELMHIGSLALQVMFANFGPMADWFYATILFLLEEPQCHKELVAEIRDKFQCLQDLTPTALTTLPYLRACMEESLRLLPSNNTGLPRYSPGALVDGHYVPKGTHVQSSIFAFSRSSRYFHEPLKFRPQRWLPPDHILYDASFAGDHLDGLYPFSLGPRSCIGREIAWTQGKLIIAKILWTFDVARVPDQAFNLERDLLHYGFLAKPELRVRFVPAARGK